jgi:hypothetical protein
MEFWSDGVMGNEIDKVGDKVNSPSPQPSPRGRGRTGSPRWA